MLMIMMMMAAAAAAAAMKVTDIIYARSSVPAQQQQTREVAPDFIRRRHRLVALPDWRVAELPAAPKQLRRA